MTYLRPRAIKGVITVIRSTLWWKVIGWVRRMASAFKESEIKIVLHGKSVQSETDQV